MFKTILPDQVEQASKFKTIPLVNSGSLKFHLQKNAQLICSPAQGCKAAQTFCWTIGSESSVN